MTEPTAPQPSSADYDLDIPDDPGFDRDLSGAMDALGVARDAIDDALAILQRKAGLR